MKSACEESPRPGANFSSVDWSQWESEGRKVSCDYHPLKNPLKHGAYKETIKKYCNVKYAPFDKDGNGNLGYLYDLSQDLARFFIEEIAKKNREVPELEFVKFLFA